MSSSVEALLDKIQEACLPGIWSKGVALARGGVVSFDSAGGDGAVIALVQRSDRPVAAKVSLWPAEDVEEADWFCDCGDRLDVCAHAAAAAIALKTRGASLSSGGASASVSDSTPGATAGEPPRPHAGQILYCFSREEGNRLRLERRIRFRDREERLSTSLVSFVGGISSGRIIAPAVAAARGDFGIDALLNEVSDRNPVPHSTLAKLLPALADSSHVFLDGKPVRTSSRRLRAHLVVRELAPKGGGFQLSRAEGAGTPGEWFANGAWLNGDLLSAAEDVSFTPEERQALSEGGVRFRSAEEIAHLVADLLPSLEAKVDLEILAPHLPRAIRTPPRAVLRFERKEDGALLVYPRVVYGDPPLAEITPEGIDIPALASEVPVRDPAAEMLLVKKMHTDLHLRPGQWSRFEGAAAIDFTHRARGWDVDGSAGRTLVPRVELRADGGFSLRFEAVDRAESDRVLEAWNSGLRERVTALLGARGHGDGRLPRALVTEASEIAEALGAEIPATLHELRQRLANPDGGAGSSVIPAVPLPTDLQADLRSYQKRGVDWLSFLRDAGLGAMLADDMGLGKTLQALCAIRGRTLVVCPSSVLHSWRDQAARFRPGLRTHLYYGPSRALDPTAEITITSYAVLRLDRERLAAENWDSVVLDEAQTIRNADSQTAMAAHDLARAKFRMTLSGTPVENRPEDLWSQFQFLNPGLLGTREDFREQAESAVSLARLRNKVRPFILRRLKRDVAPELPARTEVVLECELSHEERVIYDAVLAAGRREALAKLDSEPSGRGVLAALEALLRLRQACCDVSLIPGAPGTPPGNPISSKNSLLIDRLLESSAEGHRSLVFSQWTSLLDRIEPALMSAGIPFLRLDGSATATKRAELVREFQADSGPPVMLISLKAGGVGLTLTAADHIFLMDPWWNPAVEDQAADRAHRIGQKNPVLIHRLIATGTVEERILELQARKRHLAQSLLDGGAVVDALTREDLIELLR